MQDIISTNCPVSDISIHDLRNILAHLARSRVMVPDLETTYSRFSNTATDPKDQSLISDIMTERQNQLDAVSRVMADMKNIQQQLVDQQDKIVQSMLLHKSRTSALWRMPNELLSMIFINCHEQTYYLPSAPNQAPMLLTRVCRRWREVIEGMPSLWCNLTLSSEMGVWKQVAFFYDCCLKRSQGLALSLDIWCTGDDAILFQNLLRPYKNQIASLYLSFPEVKCPEVILQDLPALQQLSIRPHYPGQYPAIRQSISQLPSSLQTLSLSFWPLVDLKCLGSFNPVWGHLTNVTVTVYQPNVLIRLLELGPNICSLSLGVECFSDDIHAFEAFTHRKLESLWINAKPSRIFGSLLDALTLPKLRVLEVVGGGDPWEWPHEGFKTFLGRSNYGLRKLILHLDKITDEEQAEYVAVIPCLKVELNVDFFEY